jgi:hypothetical protein
LIIVVAAVVFSLKSRGVTKTKKARKKKKIRSRRRKRRRRRRRRRRSGEGAEEEERSIKNTEACRQTEEEEEEEDQKKIRSRRRKKIRRRSEVGGEGGGGGGGGEGAEGRKGKEEKRSSTGKQEKTLEAMATTAPVDVKELPTSFIFVVDVPGLRNTDVKVHFSLLRSFLFLSLDSVRFCSIPFRFRSIPFRIPFPGFPPRARAVFFLWSPRTPWPCRSYPITSGLKGCQNLASIDPWR